MIVILASCLGSVGTANVNTDNSNAVRILLDCEWELGALEISTQTLTAGYNVSLNHGRYYPCMERSNNTYLQTCHSKLFLLLTFKELGHSVRLRTEARKGLDLLGFAILKNGIDCVQLEGMADSLKKENGSFLKLLVPSAHARVVT